VQVVQADGTTEERLVTTGLSSSQYTEVIDGLSEGEEVTVTLLTSSNNDVRMPGMMMGGHPG